MSHQAVTWALAQPVRPSAAKFLLVVLAHYVPHEPGRPWHAYASVAQLVEATGQDRKTVMVNLDRLIEMGCLRDTGERAGRTKSMVVYELSEPTSGTENGTASDGRSGTKSGTAKQSQFSHEAVPNLGHLSGTKSGTPSSVEAVPNFPGSSTNFPSKQYQISPEAVPNLVPQIDIEKRKEEKKKENIPPAQDAAGGGGKTATPLDAGDLQARDVPADVAAEFLALRKRKRAPLTALALAGIQREAGKAGWTLGDVLRTCVERGWQGFNAAWVQDRNGGTARMSAQERADAEHEKFLRMTGGGDFPADDGRTFEMER